jgi:putative PIN family toxin of toxin-antitoxin system
MAHKRSRRFVFDTNVLVSAALSPGGSAREALDYANHAGYFLLSDAMFAELKEVLYREAFDPYLTNAERRRFMIALLRKSRRIEIMETIEACDDPDDDMFLEVAVCGKAECIVTRNLQDYPAERFRDIAILTPEQFLDQMR